MFCADLKKFQKLKEMPPVKQEDEEKSSVPIKKAKIKTEKQETVIKMEKPSVSSRKKAKRTPKDE